MTNISLLLAALLLAALQQQLLVVDGGTYHKEVPRKQHSTTPHHQHRHQHFLSDTGKTSQQQQQQHHHQHHHQHQRGHARQQQQQSALWQQEYKLKALLSTEPTTAVTTKTTTKSVMHKNHSLQHHHRAEQQKELQQQHQQEESSIKRFAVIAAAAAASDVVRFNATHTAVKGQKQLMLSTSTEASSTLTEVSEFSSKAASASNQHKKSASSSSSLSSTSSSSSSSMSFSSNKSPLSELADANRAQHYKSSAAASNAVVADDRRLRLKSMESLDYADDYYYDDGDDDEYEDNNNSNNNNNMKNQNVNEDNVVDGANSLNNDNNSNSHNDDDDEDDSDDVASMENYDSDSDADHRLHISSSRTASSSTTTTTSSSARVVRAHHHHQHHRHHFEPLDFIASSSASNSASRLDHQATKASLSTLHLNEPSQYLDHDQQQLLISDQDYADDEPYRSSAENYLNDAPGVLTDQKFRELGTLEAVQQTRDKMLQEQEHMRQKTPAELAREHMDRMKTAGRCSRPLPRVIHVSNETSKRYVPYCTILHRCGEDTGCCDSTRQVCAAKSFEDVPVYFFVIKVNSRSNKRDTEVLMLRNHTECHCVNRSNLLASLQYMPRDKRSDLQRRRYHHSQQLTQRNFHEESLADEMSNIICRCPKHFDIFPVEIPHAERHFSDISGSLRCRCDCLSHNIPCRRLQQGEEGFAVDERKCIAERICQAPVCLHGDYSHQTGRCPRRKNQKRTVTRYDYGYG